MKPLPLLVGFIAVFFVEEALAAGHCKPDETTYFSCEIKGRGKTVSVCGGNDWLQYRFGVLGAIELEFPIDRAGSLKRFTGADRLHSAAGVSAQWLKFDRSGTEYSVTQMEGGSNFNGVSVLLPRTAKTIDLPCDRSKPSVLKLYDAVLLVPEGNP